MKRTEERNPRTINIDKMSTYDMVSLMADESIAAFNAVKSAVSEISEAVDLIDNVFRQGGRLFYIGAGTSGRLGVIDATECPPTFGVDNGMVVGIIAGGADMMFRAAENEEDISERGKRDVENNGISDKDVLVGISASGNAAYVVEALKEAKRRKAVTIGLTCNNDALIRGVSDCTIVTDTGSEVISGSTRLNAGTAHKIVLNILSTCSMVKQGYVYENMMINLKGTNEKLKKRQIFIVSELCDITLGEAEKLLNSADGNIKAAVEAHKSRTC